MVDDHVPDDIDMESSNDVPDSSASGMWESSTSISHADLGALQECQREGEELLDKPYETREEMQTQLQRWRALGNKLKAVTLPPLTGSLEVPGPVKEMRKTLSTILSTDLKSIDVTEDHTIMNGKQLLEQVTSSELNQEERKHLDKHAKLLTIVIPVLQVFISRNKEAGSRILIDAIVCALVQAIHDIDKHFMFVLPELVLASERSSPKTITSLINGDVTMWTGLTDYGLGFGDAEGRRSKDIMALGDQIFGRERDETLLPESKGLRLQWTLIEAKRLLIKNGIEHSQLIALLPQAIAQSMVWSQKRRNSVGESIPYVQLTFSSPITDLKLPF
ncbi:hypothetical protein FS837_008231 [Tulasnella sp. UAMH 9824]|nr:hypothetical protein FS837_008231 [Tulasnella sp. UAMH 9824]